MDIDKIVRVANDPTLVKAWEPNLAFHSTVHKWQLIRFLKAMALLRKK